MNYSQDGKQYHIGLKKGDVGKYVILPGDPNDVKKLHSILTILNLLEITENSLHIQDILMEKK